MFKRTLGFLLIGAVCALPAAAGDIPGEAGYDKGMKFESDDGHNTVSMGGRVQVRFTHEEPDVGDGRGSFDIRRAKIWLKGKIYEYWKYKLQIVVSSNQAFDDSDPLDPGPDFSELEDAYFQFTKHRLAQPWIGQGKIMFGRQALTSSGKLQFVDRVSGFSDIESARSQGVGLIGQTSNDKLEYNVAVYDDLDGQNIRTNADDNYAYTGRVVFTPFGEYALDQVPFDYPETSKLAVGAKLALETVTDELGLDSDNSIVGIEAAYKRKGFSVQGEYFELERDPDVGSTEKTSAHYVQAGYLFPNKKMEVAGRYSVISPDVAGPSEDIEEKGVAFSYYFDKHNYKIQTDFRQISDDGDPTDDVDELRVQAQFIF